MKKITMKIRKIYTVALALAIQAGAASAQTVDEVLKEIESNNMTISAAAANLKAMQMENKLGNRLPDPSVSYKKAFEKSPATGRTEEITVSQGFDFPTVYIQRNRTNAARNEMLTAGYDETRQQTLLQAKQLCLDLVLLQKEGEMLEKKMKNATLIKELYDTKMKEGSATAIELNKAELEYLNAESELIINATRRDQTIRALTALNGGKELPFLPAEYSEAGMLPPIDELTSEVMAQDASSRKAQGMAAVAKKELTLEKHSMLPSFDVKYIRETSFDATSNAFEVGMSVPLWEKAGNVKRAKAAALASTYEAENLKTTIENELAASYSEALRLQNTMQRFTPDMFDHSLEVLKKAFDHKEISIIDYFDECNNIYQSIQTYLNLENSYHKALANIMRHRL